VSLSQINGEHDEFDYKLSLDQSKFLGIESDNMQVKGTGRIVHAGQEADSEGEEFTIEGPITGFRVAFEVKAESNGESKKIDFTGIDFTLEEDKVTISSASSAFNEHGHSAEVKKWVQARLSEELHNIKKEAFKGKESII